MMAQQSAALNQQQMGDILKKMYQSYADQYAQAPILSQLVKGGGGQTITWGGTGSYFGVTNTNYYQWTDPQSPYKEEPFMTLEVQEPFMYLELDLV